MTPEFLGAKCDTCKRPHAKLWTNHSERLRFLIGEGWTITADHEQCGICNGSKLAPLPTVQPRHWDVLVPGNPGYDDPERLREIVEELLERKVVLLSDVVEILLDAVDGNMGAAEAFLDEVVI